MHYTELYTQLKLAGFDCGIFDDEAAVVQPRIYLNGYGDNAKVYLFADPSRRQNDYSNPISGFGLHVGINEADSAKRKMLKRCSIKHKVMTDLHLQGFALKPVADFKFIGL